MVPVFAKNGAELGTTRMGGGGVLAGLSESALQCRGRLGKHWRVVSSGRRGLLGVLWCGRIVVAPALFRSLSGAPAGSEALTRRLTTGCGRECCRALVPARRSGA